MSVDARIIEHDAYCACDEVCIAHEDRRTLAALTWEQARREACGEEHVDPSEPTLEERLGPYGIEWEMEQRERMEGR